MRPIERLAAFKAAVTLHELTMGEAAQDLGVSYNHLILVLRGERIGSRRLEQAISMFVGIAVHILFDPQR
jgi:hypothetical protein